MEVPRYGMDDVLDKTNSSVSSVEPKGTDQQLFQSPALSPTQAAHQLCNPILKVGSCAWAFKPPFSFMPRACVFLD